MGTNPQDLAKRLLRKEWELLSGHERRVIEAVLRRTSVSRDVTREAADGRTLGERLSDRIAAFGGSWRFILLFLAFMIVWAMLNTEILGPRHEAVDPYPYVFLNLMLSMLAALQAPIIMMSQNRQSMRDRQQADADYEVNLKSELEIRHLHEKLDALRGDDWREMLQLQREQVRLLGELLDDRRGGAGTPPARDAGDGQSRGS